MKRILLTSSGLFLVRQDVDNLLPKKLNQCRIAYITTAAKSVSNTDYMTRQKNEMDAKGLTYVEIDIEGKTQCELEIILSGYDVVFVEGGNTFYLLKAVRDSGFDIVIKKLVASGVVYVGSSAGSYIACPSIVMTTWSKQGFDRCGVTDISALNMVPFYIKAHYSIEMEELLNENAHDLKYPLYALTDQQAIALIDEEIIFLGEGEKRVWSSEV